MCKSKIFQQKNRHKRRQKRGSGQPVPHSVEADVQLQVSRVGHHHLHLRPGKILSWGGNERNQTFDPVPTFMLMCTVVLKGFVCTTVMSLSLGMLCATWIALLCGSAWLMSTTCRRRAQVLKRKQLYAHLPIRLVGGKVDILKIGRQGNTTSDKEEGKGKLDHDFGGNMGESGQ